MQWHPCNSGWLQNFEKTSRRRAATSPRPLFPGPLCLQRTLHDLTHTTVRPTMWSVVSRPVPSHVASRSHSVGGSGGRADGRRGWRETGAVWVAQTACSGTVVHLSVAEPRDAERKIKNTTTTRGVCLRACVRAVFFPSDATRLEGNVRHCVPDQKFLRTDGVRGITRRVVSRPDDDRPIIAFCAKACRLVINPPASTFGVLSQQARERAMAKSRA